MIMSAKRVQQLSTTAGFWRIERNLYLQVEPPNACSWIARYQLCGEEYNMGLGSYPDFSLADARERIRKVRQQLADGINPLEEKRKAAVRGITFEASALQCFESMKGRWGNEKHAAQFQSTMQQYVYPVIGMIAVEDLTEADVLRVPEKKWPQHGGQRFWDARPENCAARAQSSGEGDRLGYCARYPHEIKSG